MPFRTEYHITTTGGGAPEYYAAITDKQELLAARPFWTDTATHNKGNPNDSDIPSFLSNAVTWYTACTKPDSSGNLRSDRRRRADTDLREDG
jgi:hypothetical protein